MFAVPGWSLSAPLVQDSVRRKNGKNSADDSQQKSKKRKRNDDHPGTTHQVFDIPSIAKSKPLSSKPAQPPHLKSAQNIERNVHTNGARSTKFKDEASNSSKLGHESGTHESEHTSTVKKSKITEKSTSKRPKHPKNVPNQASSTSNIGDNVKPQTSPTTLPPALPPTLKLTPLQAKMRSKLTSARFRHLNETLYTTSSAEALDLFTKSPDLFAEYHAGFSQQVKDSWPQNPVEGYVKAIKVRGSLQSATQGTLPLPRRKTGSCTIADLGCGDARLARGSQANIKSLQLKFHSFDLHAPNTLVTKADISNLPLRDGEADIVVFCLSLMGTNWIAFVEEAWRILRGDGKGEIWIAEVKSRFGRVTKGRVVDNSVGKRRKVPKPREDDSYDGPEQFVEDTRMADQPDDETDVSAFVKVFTRRGFQLRESSINKSNKMFVSMVFTKSGIPTAGKHKGLKWTGKEYVKQDGMGKSRFTNKPGFKGEEEEITVQEEAKVLKPCVYKIR